ncbi:hypothetical protein RFI_03117 [Reticulomyxa filosa]|uniref:Uncharacterized protein n=1 Tax=Reticulomyxa filosa TaxID=46433 RepID=X6P637_RETFI|nr:hypothetical protein RFI_03117 [Reticulomyxa filosa]|eukprot:ETO33980.1 hypothetical protein RFI_03117 [Reticulomyxa filosa]
MILIKSLLIVLCSFVYLFSFQITFVNIYLFKTYIMEDFPISQIFQALQVGNPNKTSLGFNDDIFFVIVIETT